MTDIKHLREYLRASVAVGRDIGSVFDAMKDEQRVAVLMHFAGVKAPQQETPAPKPMPKMVPSTLPAYLSGNYKVIYPDTAKVDFDRLPAAYRDYHTPRGSFDLSLRKIHTIKVVLHVTGAGLREVKDFVEGSATLYLSLEQARVLGALFTVGLVFVP